MKVYKYYRVNEHSIQALSAKSFWVAPARSFNDPFEFRLSLPDCCPNEIPGFSKAKDELLDEGHKEIDDSMYLLTLWGANQYALNQFGIVCFSDINDSILMWSHYADSHTGFCLGFARS